MYQPIEQLQLYRHFNRHTSSLKRTSIVKAQDFLEGC